ncbi:hypothetical protein [Flavisphingomonas formosensis]|uniref:hypothetical protein n=1 Tax=Flavisphingomonas formosensis TaxID=861534 RepID=UPI0012F8F2C1|nr:hypothetical protein [Sphingomonas formosensis]
MHLVDAANVMTPAYLAILSKGYSVWSDKGLMLAEREGDRFIADGPVPLLGLIAMAEIRGEMRQASDQEIGQFIALFG